MMVHKSPYILAFKSDRTFVKKRIVNNLLVANKIDFWTRFKGRALWRWFFRPRPETSFWDIAWVSLLRITTGRRRMRRESNERSQEKVGISENLMGFVSNAVAFLPVVVVAKRTTGKPKN